MDIVSLSLYILSLDFKTRNLETCYDTSPFLRTISLSCITEQACRNANSWAALLDDPFLFIFCPHSLLARKIDIHHGSSRSPDSVFSFSFATEQLRCDVPNPNPISRSLATTMQPKPRLQTSLLFFPALLLQFLPLTVETLTQERRSDQRASERAREPCSVAKLAPLEPNALSSQPRPARSIRHERAV